MKIWTIEAEGETVGTLEEGTALSALLRMRADELSVHASGRAVPPARRHHRRPVYTTGGPAASGGHNIYAGYAQSRNVNPDTDQLPMSWMHATWNVPRLTVPLWVWTFLSKYPHLYDLISVVIESTHDVNSAIAAMDGLVGRLETQEEEVVFWALFNAIEFGFRCSPWIGLMSGILESTLIQVGVGSAVSLMPAAWSIDGQPQLSYSEWDTFFQWTSAGGARMFNAGPVASGDTIKAFIHIFDDTPVVGASDVFVYLGNTTQDWYCAFFVRSVDVGLPKPLLNFQRQAVWTVEQSTTAVLTSDPLVGSASVTSLGPFPMARYGDVFFCDALCGGWAGRSGAPVGTPFPPVGDSWPTWGAARPPSTNTEFGNLNLTHPDRVIPGGNVRYLINDVSTSWISLPIPAEWAPPTNWSNLPPVGAADQPVFVVPFDYTIQYGTGYRIPLNFTSRDAQINPPGVGAVGYPVAVGQLAGENLVLSSYVYAGDGQPPASFVLNDLGIVPLGVAI